MTWTEQTENVMKVWTDAQKKLWEGWFEATRNLGGSSTFAPGMGMGMFEQWQKIAMQGMEALTSNADPTSRNVARQFVATQATVMQFLEMTTRAWNLMMPKLEAGEDWQTALSNYMEEFRKQMMPNAGMMMQASNGMTDLWRLYLGHLQTVAQPWMKSWQQTPGHLGVAMAGEGGSELIDLTRLYWNAYDQTMGSITGMPGVGFTRELEEKLAKGFAAWQEAMQAMNEYQLLMADAWAGVHEQVMREMMSRAEQGKPIQSVRDLVKLWTGAADKSFDQIFRSEKYAEVQGAFVRTYMEYRIHEQHIVDEMMKYSHIPTRTEMDEAHRNIYELRREVKALKKALKESEATNGTGKKATPAKKPTPSAPPQPSAAEKAEK